MNLKDSLNRIRVSNYDKLGERSLREFFQAQGFKVATNKQIKEIAKR